MAIPVAGELYYELDGQLCEIKRQLRQPAGYPFDPTQLRVALQNAIAGMHIDGCGNFFFVETGYTENPVSVGCVGRGSRGWARGGVSSLAYGNRWDADDRLLVRNLSDTLKL